MRGAWPDLQPKDMIEKVRCSHEVQPAAASVGALQSHLQPRVRTCSTSQSVPFHACNLDDRRMGELSHAPLNCPRRVIPIMSILCTICTCTNVEQPEDPASRIRMQKDVQTWSHLHPTRLLKASSRLLPLLVLSNAETHAITLSSCVYIWLLAA